jgi:glycosyltransferase involved in cell wall biosynthesis
MRYVFLASRLFFLRKPIFFHEHFGDIDIDHSIKWHQQYIYPKTIMICVSRKIYDWAINNLKVSSEKAFILHNIIVKKEGLPARSPQNNDDIKLVMVCNIRRTKNIEFAIELLSRLKLTQRCSLTIIGKKTDPAYYDEIITLVEKHRLTGSVQMIHDADEVQLLLHGYDIAVHTARSESGPLVLIEYLAQGLPFLTYNTGETVLQLKDELPGSIASTFDVEEWVTKITRLLSADRPQLQQQLQDAFNSHFSAEAYYIQCMEIYSKGLARQL